MGCTLHQPESSEPAGGVLSPGAAAPASPPLAGGLVEPASFLDGGFDASGFGVGLGLSPDESSSESSSAELSSSPSSSSFSSTPERESSTGSSLEQANAEVLRAAAPRMKATLRHSKLFRKPSDMVP